MYGVPAMYVCAEEGYNFTSYFERRYNMFQEYFSYL